MTAAGQQLTLFVTGDAPRSRRARANLHSLLITAGYDASSVTEVDLLKHPGKALDCGIVTSPALLLTQSDGAGSVMYGDLPDQGRLAAFLGMSAQSQDPAADAPAPVMQPQWSDVAWAAIDAAYDSVLITDAQLDRPGPRILHANPSFCRMTGYDLADIVGKTPHVLQGPDTDPAVMRRLRQDLEAGRFFEGRTTNYRKDGTPFEMEWTIAPVTDAGGRVTHYVAVQRDVTERHRLMELLNRQAVVDPLTETFNRRHGVRVLNAEIERGRRHGQPFAVIMLDIDHFKAINDRHGHQVGDDVLRRMANLLGSRLRATDTLCRWGGEEFLAILANTDLPGACALAEDIRTQIAGASYSEGLTITVSLGVAVHDGTADCDALVDRADGALYAAKAAGRNRVVTADEADIEPGRTDAGS